MAIQARTREDCRLISVDRATLSTRLRRFGYVQDVDQNLCIVAALPAVGQATFKCVRLY